MCHLAQQPAQIELCLFLQPSFGRYHGTQQPAYKLSFEVAFSQKLEGVTFHNNVQTLSVENDGCQSLEGWHVAQSSADIELWLCLSPAFGRSHVSRQLVVTELSCKFQPDSGQLTLPSNLNTWRFCFAFSQSVEGVALSSNMRLELWC